MVIKMKIVFLHGLGQSGDSFSKTVSLLDIPGAVTDSPDLFSLSRGGRDFDSLYKAVSDYLDAAPEKINICGLSLGAVIALRYAAERPGKVVKLALIAPQYKPPKFLLKLQDLLFALMPEKNFAGIGLPKKDFRKLCSTMADIDLTDELSKLVCPTLLMVGENDRANRGAAEKLAGILPDANLKIIGNSGHEVNSDAPEELAKLLSKFFKS